MTNTMNKQNATLHITFSTLTNFQVIEFSGMLEGCATQRLISLQQQLLRYRGKDYIFDLSGAQAISYSVIVLFSEIAKTLFSRNGQVYFINSNPALQNEMLQLRERTMDLDCVLDESEVAQLAA